MTIWNFHQALQVFYPLYLPTYSVDDLASYFTKKAEVIRIGTLPTLFLYLETHLYLQLPSPHLSCLRGKKVSPSNQGLFLHLCSWSIKLVIISLSLHFLRRFYDLKQLIQTLWAFPLSPIICLTLSNIFTVSESLFLYLYMEIIGLMWRLPKIICKVPQKNFWNIEST